MMQRIKKVLAILLAVCFLATVTAGAVSAHADDNGHYIVHEDHHKQIHKPVPPPVHKQVHKSVHKPVPQPVHKPVIKSAPKIRP